MRKGAKEGGFSVPPGVRGRGVDIPGVREKGVDIPGGNIGEGDRQGESAEAAALLATCVK